LPGLDTNVLVRLLVADDIAQTPRARALVERCIERQESVLIPLPVIIETEWVLRTRYAMSKAEALEAFRTLLAVREFGFEDEASSEEALYHWQAAPPGFVDCRIAADNRRLGCAATATFEVRASRLPGFVAA